MQIKRKRLWCILTIMMIFISGMHFEEIKVDSSLLNTAAVETTSYIFPVNSVIADEQVCTPQMLGIHNNIVITQLVIRFIKQKGAAKISLDYLCEKFFFAKERNLYVSLKEVNLFKDEQSNLIIKYIQNSDGKKRI